MSRATVIVEGEWKWPTAVRVRADYSAPFVAEIQRTFRNYERTWDPKAREWCFVSRSGDWTDERTEERIDGYLSVVVVSIVETHFTDVTIVHRLADTTGGNNA